MKKYVKIIMLITICVVWLFPIYAQEIQKDSLYLGQTPPQNTPQIFKLSIASKSFAAERIAISKDGKTIYYQELDGYSEMDGKPHTQRVKYMNFLNEKWTGPFILFEGFGAPCLSITGDTMYVQKGIKEAFYSVKESQGWSAPKRFLTKLQISHYLQITNGGNYYISSNAPNSVGEIDRCKLIVNGADTLTTSLGAPINTLKNDLDYFIARDESFMIVTTRNGLCISYNKKEKGWTEPKNLGKEINFGLGAWGPYVTADNKYLFYTTGTKPDYSDTYIYWVSVGDIINKPE